MRHAKSKLPTECKVLQGVHVSFVADLGLGSFRGDRG